MNKSCFPRFFYDFMLNCVLQNYLIKAVWAKVNIFNIQRCSIQQCLVTGALSLISNDVSYSSIWLGALSLISNDVSYCSIWLGALSLISNDVSYSSIWLEALFLISKDVSYSSIWLGALRCYSVKIAKNCCTFFAKLLLNCVTTLQFLTCGLDTRKPDIIKGQRLLKSESLRSFTLVALPLARHCCMLRYYN